MPPALQFLVLTFAGWVNRHQADLIEHLREGYCQVKQNRADNGPLFGLDFRVNDDSLL